MDPHPCSALRIDPQSNFMYHDPPLWNHLAITIQIFHCWRLISSTGLLNNSWWGREALIHFPCWVLGNLDWQTFSHRSAALNLQCAYFPLRYSCRYSLCALRLSASQVMFSGNTLCSLCVDCEHLKHSWKPGSHKQTAGYCFQMNCNALLLRAIPLSAHFFCRSLLIHVTPCWLVYLTSKLCVCGGRLFGLCATVHH